MSTCRQESRRMYARIQKYFGGEGVGFREIIIFSGMGGGGVMTRLQLSPTCVFVNYEV